MERSIGETKIDYEVAGKVLEDLGLTMRFIMADIREKMGSGVCSGVDEFRKYEYIFGRVRHSALIWEMRARIMALGYMVWDGVEDSELVFGLRWSDFYDEKFGLAYISPVMYRVLKLAEGEIGDYVRARVVRWYSYKKTIGQLIDLSRLERVSLNRVSREGVPLLRELHSILEGLVYRIKDESGSRVRLIMEKDNILVEVRYRRGLRRLPKPSGVKLGMGRNMFSDSFSGLEIRE
jgi:hypothetical protein